MTTRRYEWAAPGDVNAFFGLMLDNIADLVLTVSLLQVVFEFPTGFALQHMIPGTALGVLVGDLLFFALALRLARRTGRHDVTAMPLGLDTPSTIGMVLFVVGPAFRHAQGELGYTESEAATYAWHIGICSIFVSGLFKLVCALGSGAVRRVVPRAGLLGSLTAVALVLISFLPLLDVMRFPLVGMVSLAVVLTTLVARVQLPWRIPGALGALLIASAVYYAMWGMGLLERESAGFDPSAGLLPTGWLLALDFGWTRAFLDSLFYLPIVIPFALATVVGGIDCTESAAAAGDEYDTNQIIAVEGLATLVAALCGGVIQTTPYIGHPAYKAMGGRAAYTLATALFIGSAGLLGFFGYLYIVIPKAAIFTILIFIGLEITAQSFQATPKRHYAAIALACVPAMAKLVMIFAGGLLGQMGKGIDDLAPPLADQLQTIQILSGGFIVTSLIWGSALAAIIDHRFAAAGWFFVVAAGCSLFGLIHSPLASEQLVLPWAMPPEVPHAAAGQTPLFIASGYVTVAVLMFAFARIIPPLPRHSAETAELAIPRTLEPEVMASEEEARDYDAMDHSHVNRLFVTDLLAVLQPDGEILDLGTGTAQIPVELCRRAADCRVVAVDMSIPMLELARYNVEVAGVAGRILLDHVDAKQLPYEDNRFQAVISNSIVHHIAEPACVLREAVRVTARGGLLFFRDLLRPANQDELQHLVQTYAGDENEHQRKMFADSLRAALNLDEVKDAVAQLGFDPQTVRATSDRHWTWTAWKKSDG